MSGKGKINMRHVKALRARFGVSADTFAWPEAQLLRRSRSLVR
mgnify:CR=1 FL=1